MAPHEAFPKAREATLRALEINDDELAEAHASLAYGLANYDWNWPEAEKRIQTQLRSQARLLYCSPLVRIHVSDRAWPELDQAIAEARQAFDPRSAFSS